MSEKQNVQENMNSDQVLFWALLGPFCLLVSFAFLILKSSSDTWFFTLCTLTAIPFCFFYRMHGLVGALLMLAFLTVITTFSLPISERYWHVGIALSMGLSFVILALSIEEAQSLLEALETESKSRLGHLFRLDEKLKHSQPGHHPDSDKVLIQGDIFNVPPNNKKPPKRKPGRK